MLFWDVWNTIVSLSNFWIWFCIKLCISFFKINLFKVITSLIIFIFVFQQVSISSLKEILHTLLLCYYRKIYYVYKLILFSGLIWILIFVNSDFLRVFNILYDACRSLLLRSTYKLIKTWKHENPSFYFKSMPYYTRFMR